jgi:Pathogenicity locus
MIETSLLTIPGIGKRFCADFARIDIKCVEQLIGQNPDKLYQRLIDHNASELHPTSKNYLYVIRMAVYYANGGRDSAKLTWNAWKN